MSEESQQDTASNDSRPEKRRRKFRFWIVFLIIALTVYLTPLLGYCWRVGEAVFEHGFSQQTLTTITRHTDWFKRYFTGPPSDDEMIALFQAHKTDFERAAYFFARHGFCHDQEIPADLQLCMQLQERTGTKVSVTGPIVDNSIYRRPNYMCSYPCFVQQHYFYSKEPQDWWRSRNSEIEAWQKSFLYVPPLLPAERFGLNPKHYPDDTLEVMRRNCHQKKSLDSIPPEIENASVLEEKCATRHIGGQWFIYLYPIVKDRT